MGSDFCLIFSAQLIAILLQKWKLNFVNKFFMESGKCLLLLVQRRQMIVRWSSLVGVSLGVTVGHFGTGGRPENYMKSKSFEDPSNFVHQVIDQKSFLLTAKIALRLVNDPPCDFSPFGKNLNYWQVIYYQLIKVDGFLGKKSQTCELTYPPQFHRFGTCYVFYKFTRPRFFTPSQTQTMVFYGCPKCPPMVRRWNGTIVEVSARLYKDVIVAFA